MQREAGHRESDTHDHAPASAEFRPHPSPQAPERPAASEQACVAQRGFFARAHPYAQQHGEQGEPRDVGEDLRQPGIAQPRAGFAQCALGEDGREAPGVAGHDAREECGEGQEDSDAAIERWSA